MIDRGSPDASSPEARRARLATLLRQRALAPRRAPASFAQRRLWLLDRLAPGTAVYNLPLLLRVRGPFDTGLIERALNEMVKRHEALRTTFAARDGEPQQVIAPSLELTVSRVDLRGLPERAREAEARRIAGLEARRPFDLAEGPLVRATDFRLGETERLLLWVLHHAVFDGWSSEILIREILAFYDAFVAGRPPALPELPAQYADFAAWQRSDLSGPALDERLAYWRTCLEGLSPLELASDRPRATARTGDGASLPVTLGPAVTERLKALCRAEGATPFMALLAAFQALLHRRAGQDDVAVGVPVAGRDRADVAGIIGCFVNTLVLRTDCAGDPSFRELLRRVRAVALGATAHADLPFERLVEELQPERAPGRPPLVQVLFTFQSVPLVLPPHPTCDMRLVDCDTGTAKFDLALELSDLPDGIQGRLEYSADLFDADTVSRMARHLEALLEGALADPDRPLSAVSLLTAAEARQIREWNDTRVERAGPDRPHAAPVALPPPARRHELPVRLHELVQAQAARTPDACAVAFEDGALTYRELEERAGDLARRLVERGVGRDAVAGVCMERSLELPVALLAVLEAGGAYLPLDPALPPARLGFLVEDARARAIVGSPQLRDRLPASAGAIPWVDVDLAPPSGAPRGAPRAGAEDDLAYVIYTSGSTGAPKGAMNTHRAIVNRLLWMQEAYRLGPRDRVLQKTPFGFDVSVWELFWPLIAGATLVMARPGGHRDPAYLSRVVEEQGITVLHFVPSMLRVFLDEPAIEESCRSLRHVFSSGEVLSAGLRDRFFARMRASLHNLYGPTEAAVDVTAWTCGRDGATSGAGVPIGRPIANVRAHVLDRHLRPVPIGLPGELYLGGVALARGYLHRPDLTAERFLPDPEGAPGERLYRTGDLARWRADGALEFIGRVDHQVKLRGQRVELGEVEAALAGLPGVREAAAMVRADGGREGRLVAYVVGDASPAELRALLRRALPEYMVPAAFVALPALPLTPSGKLDRAALPAPGAERPELEQAFVAPRTPVEDALAAIWREVLGLPRVGAHDNFFDLGGASIQCLQVVSRAQGEGLPLTPPMMFEHQTVAELAAVLAAASAPAPEGA